MGAGAGTAAAGIAAMGEAQAGSAMAALMPASKINLSNENKNRLSTDLLLQNLTIRLEAEYEKSPELPGFVREVGAVKR
jgi:hypothetical protein